MTRMSSCSACRRWWWNVWNCSRLTWDALAAVLMFQPTRHARRMEQEARLTPETLPLPELAVLAEEAVPMTELDLAVLDQRIADAQEDEIAAKTDSDRQKAGQMVDDLKLVRAAF